jgi:hypothetical protein
MATETNPGGDSEESGLVDASKPDEETQPIGIEPESARVEGVAMDAGNNSDPESVLRQWRATILNVFFAVVAIISLPAIGAIIARAISGPGIWPVAIAFSVIELILIALAVMRGLPVNIRIGGLCVIGYTAAVLNLATTGLGGAGPLYLLAIPILILILMGKRASFIAAISSGLLAISCAVLIDQGQLVPDVNLRTPWTGLTTIIMFLTIMMTILILTAADQGRTPGPRRVTGCPGVAGATECNPRTKSPGTHQ